MRKTQLALLAAALVMATQARAALFDITFTSNDGSVVGSGTLNGTFVSSGVYEATAGSFFDIETGADGFTPGLYTIVNNPSSPNTSTSPSGFFYFDNQVLQGQNPFLTNAGLLFSGPGGGGLELNLFSNGPSPVNGLGTYQLYDNSSVNVFGDATLTAVPEASTMLAGALMLLPLGVSAVRIMRKNVMA